jgi:hypothetical protein
MTARRGSHGYHFFLRYSDCGSVLASRECCDVLQNFTGMTIKHYDISHFASSCRVRVEMARARRTYVDMTLGGQLWLRIICRLAHSSNQG